MDRDRDGAQVFYRIVDPNLISMCRPVCLAIAAREDLPEVQRQALMRMAEAEYGLKKTGKRA